MSKISVQAYPNFTLDSGSFPLADLSTRYFLKDDSRKLKLANTSIRDLSSPFFLKRTKF